MSISPAGPGTKNDCAGEDQQQFTVSQSGKRVSRLSQSGETEKYGHGSRGAQIWEWLCWRKPAAIYPKPEIEVRQPVRQRRETEKCSHGSRKPKVVSRLSQSRETEKYDHRSCGARNQEQLCWRRPAAIYPKPKVSQSWVGTSSRWSAVSTQAEESPLLEAATEQRLVNT
jgi:hypothetical protein